MNPIQISTKLARKIVTSTQLLDSSNITEGKEGVAQIINKLGYIQIDTIAVIKRSHHHTLWTRQKNYNEKMIDELQTNDRRIFEYWGHAMSYIPMSDYRYFLPKMKKFENPTSKWAQHQMQMCSSLLEPILKRIRDEGPLSAKDFSAPPGNKGKNWWEWKPAKIALELLFWKGDLMITQRNNFQKIYDLTERVLPKEIDTTTPDNNELGQFVVRRALSALGIAADKEIQRFMQPDSARDSDIQFASKETISKSLKNLEDAGEVVPVIIEKNQDSIYYALSDTIKNSGSLEHQTSPVFLLSPFDNLIIQRDRTKTLFEFDYTLECYVPAPKRKYGYFVLPILWEENFVGRLDPKADRKNKTLIIRSLDLELQSNYFDAFLPLFTKQLIHLAKFNECEKLVLENVSPGKIKTTIEHLIKKIS